MRICVLASGSSGNAVFVESGKTRLLIDAGLALAELEARLRSVGVDPASIRSILFTHEHADHVRAAGSFGRRYKVPLRFNGPTLRAVTGLRYCRTEEFETGTPFPVDGLWVTPFSVPHDAADPVGFTVEDGRSKAALAADLGHVTRLVLQRVADAEALLLESNHDPHLLETGPYPRELKQRVAGKHGHLSNPQCGAALAEAVGPRTREVVLVHLSETNNTPALALAMARETLARQGAEELPVSTASQRRPGPMIEV